VALTSSSLPLETSPRGRIGEICPALFPPAIRTDKKQGDDDREEEAELDGAGMIHGRTPHNPDVETHPASGGA
jgi:hypothetical protein